MCSISFPDKCVLLSFLLILVIHENDRGVVIQVLVLLSIISNRSLCAILGTHSRFPVMIRYRLVQYLTLLKLDVNLVFSCLFLNQLYGLFLLIFSLCILPRLLLELLVHSVDRALELFDLGLEVQLLKLKYVLSLK